MRKLTYFCIFNISIEMNRFDRKRQWPAIYKINICPSFSYVRVSYQSNQTKPNASIFHGATAYLTSITQLLGTTVGHHVLTLVVKLSGT